MKRFILFRVISNVLSALVSIATIMVLAGLFEIPKSIRLYVFYPLLFAMLIGSVLLWIISNQLQKKDKK